MASETQPTALCSASNGAKRHVTFSTKKFITNFNL